MLHGCSAERRCGLSQVVLCGRALVSAWELTGDERYLDAARKSGDWAMSRPLVSNWNYNAFSVGLLARLAAPEPQNDYPARYLVHFLRRAASISVEYRSQAV